MSAPGERLQKVLAQMGYASRRQIEVWIQSGRIQVNGRVAQLGHSVTVDDSIFIDGKPVKQPVRPIHIQVLAYHKPEGQVCSANDPAGRDTVFNHLPKVETRWVMVGRLDINTSGLLLFTTDGEMAHRLMHPSYHIEREYAVRVLGDVQSEHLMRLSHGVELDDGMAHFTHVSAAGGEGANRWYYVCLKEGRNREVRRLWEALGFQVSRLMRIRYGLYQLPPRLRRGQYQLLADEEINQLRQLVDLPRMKHKLTSHQGQRVQAQQRTRQLSSRRRQCRR